MLDFKKETEKLLNRLKEMKIDRRTIEAELGYKENYIDQVLSKGGNQKFLKTLERYYVEKSNANSDLVNKITGLEKQLSQMLETNIGLTASVHVLQQIVDKVVSDQKETSIAIVAGERKKAERMEADRLFYELKQKS